MNISMKQVTNEEWNGRGKDQELGISRCKLVYMGQINNQVLLYSIGNCFQYLVINQNGKECEKKNTCTHIYMCVYNGVTLLQSRNQHNILINSTSVKFRKFKELYFTINSFITFYEDKFIHYSIYSNSKLISHQTSLFR